jgi:hypothetical protein
MIDTGIDTIEVTLTDFEIRNPALKLNQSVETDTGISDNHVLWRENGVAVMGNNAVYVGPDFHLRIGASKHTGVVGARLTFSASRKATGSNYSPATANELRTAFNSVESDIKSLGVYTNILVSTLYRVDVTKNILSEENYASYYPILKALPTRLKDTWDYGSSLLLKNTQQQVNIYDKIAEMKSKKHNTDNLPNTIRFEQRFMKPQKVKNYLGMTTPHELLNNLDHIAAKYTDSMRKNIFPKETFEYEVTTTQQHVSELTAIKEKHQKALESYLMLLGYQQATANGDEALLAAIDEAFDCRKAVSRAKNTLNTLKMEALSLEPAQRGKKKGADLYAELREKVLAP